MRVRTMVDASTTAAAAAALTAERAVVRASGRRVPDADRRLRRRLEDEQLALTAIVVSVDGARVARAEGTGRVGGRRHASASDAADACWRAARAEILAEVQRTQAAVEGLQP